MTKREMIQRVTERVSGMKPGDTEAVVNTLFEVLSRTLSVREGRVEIRGFGAFRVLERKAREGRNPQTGEAIQIPARRVVQFRPGKELVHRINGEEGG